jgi:prepilin-type N-terminal cleavage/methylation domain-containing protein/prepilin-type processing-associated H-X9-DG protein
MMKRTGFTLTEMLVVLVIIGILAGIAYPISRSMVGKAREAACLTNLRSVGVGLQGYLQEHNDKMPELAQGRASKLDEQPVLETVLLPYLQSAEAFHCPADKTEFPKTGSSYFWNSTQSGLQISKLAIFGIKDRPDKVPLIYDKEAWHPNKVNFLYADMSSSNKFRTVVGN